MSTNPGFIMIRGCGAESGAGRIILGLAEPSRLVSTRVGEPRLDGGREMVSDRGLGLDRTKVVSLVPGGYKGTGREIETRMGAAQVALVVFAAQARREIELFNRSPDDLAEQGQVHVSG